MPVFNGIFFTRVPIYPLVDEGEKGLTLKQLAASKTFWIMMLMMVCAGASEQSVSQWVSAFAEEGLGVSKTIGDLAGPTAFAALMGTSRLIYGKLGHRIDINKFMGFSCVLCIAAYLCISIVQNPAIELISCAVCGFSVGILWPATFSKASASIKGGGHPAFCNACLGGRSRLFRRPHSCGLCFRKIRQQFKSRNFGGDRVSCFTAFGAFAFKKKLRRQNQKGLNRIFGKRFTGRI